MTPEQSEPADTDRTDDGGDNSGLHVTLIVPAYNETGNLERMVERTMSTLRDEANEWTFGILLVVSKNSDDGTEALAQRLASEHDEVTVLSRSQNPGFGNAIKDGFRHADGDILVPFMADLSDDPADVPKLVAKIREGYDVVYGSRFQSASSIEGYPRLKLLYNRAFNNSVRLLFGIKERDVTNAFTAYRREVLDEIGVDTLQAEGFDITVELPLCATIEGFRATEVPVSWTSREAGVSKLNATKKGPVYVQRVLTQFVRGNRTGLGDLFSAVTTQSTARIVGAALFGIALLVVLFALSGFIEVFAVLTETNPLFLSAIFVVYSMSFIMRTWRWRVLLRASGHVASRANTFRCIMTGWLLNSLVPARAGDVLRGYALKTSDGTPFGVAAGTIAVERVLDMFVLGLLMSTVAATYTGGAQTEYLAVAAFAIGAVLTTGLAAVYFFSDSIISRVEPLFPRLVDPISNVRIALQRVGENPYAVALSGLLTVPVWLFEISTVFFAARAVGLSIDIFPMVAAAISAFVSQTVPITPGGLGTYEAAISSMLTLFDVDASVAMGLALVDHFIRFVFIFVVGSISTVHLVFQSRPYFNRQTEFAPIAREE